MREQPVLRRHKAFSVRSKPQLVLRLRSSHHFAAITFANFRNIGNKGALANP
jgi:hypothetical protein